MKKGISPLLLLCCSMLSTGCFSQQAFTKCSAAFLDSKIIVDEYTTKGKCELWSGATGNLSVYTVDLSPTESKAVDKLPFRVAVRDQNTKTLLLITKEEVKQIDVKTLLATCKKGDSLVLLMVNDQYAMPHNEILVK